MSGVPNHVALRLPQRRASDFGERQKAVYDELSGQEDMTNSEIAASLYAQINTIVPRVFELRQKGLVAEACRRECRVTGDNV